MASSVEVELREHLRYNVAVNMSDGAFYGLALGFGSFGTIVTLFVTRLTTSPILIGMIPSIHAMCWSLPQLFTAGQVARLRRFKTSVLLSTIHERIPFFGLAIVAWFWPVVGTQIALALTFLMLVWQGLGAGVTANPWQSMIAKIIPSRARGTFFGTQAAASSVMTSLGAVAAGYLLAWLDSPTNFSLCFLITGAFMVVSFVFLAQTREPTDTLKEIPTTRRPFWHDARTILRKDSNFLWFLGSKSIFTVATMGFAFYIVYALERFNMDVVTAGWLTATLTISQTLANAGMGWLGDRWSHRNMLILGAVTLALSSLLAWGATALWWFYPIFALEGLASVALWTTSMTMTVNFGNETERPMYIGLSNTLSAPTIILAPLIGGWLAGGISYQATFMVSAVVGIISVVMLYFLVKEPLGGITPQVVPPSSPEIL